MYIKRAAINRNISITGTLLLLFCGLAVCGQSGRLDSLLIDHALREASALMSLDQYDSAQVWLNKIHEKITYRKPSLFSYLLTSRQAEVYYYNDLQQLGLQEAQRAIQIANALNDSMLKADAYNFSGLFYNNLGRTTEAIIQFKRGITFSKQPPYPARYTELTTPNHLYGNLSEAFEKRMQYDSAIHYGHLSLQKAMEVKENRGIASASLNLGNSLYKNKTIDSAEQYLRLAKKVAQESNHFDLALNGIGSLALCAVAGGQKVEAMALLKEGFVLLEKYPQLNSFYSLQFLDQAIQVFEHYRQYEPLAKTLQRKSDLQNETRLKNNLQYRNILMTGLKNETRILNMEVAEARQGRVLATTRLYLFGLFALLLIAGFLAYRNYAKQRLSVANLRNKISQDLHDEVGATLSGIALYSYISREQNKARQYELVAQSLEIIGRNATEMVKKLSDIVWAVNPVHDSLGGLLQRLDEYAVETAAVKDIQVMTSIDEGVKAAKISMEQRKNIYLICKETINNAIKYSGCQYISIVADVVSGGLQISINDDGTGFDTQTASKGNGLTNMQHRAHEINAGITLASSAGRGTSMTLRCKITQ